jgi:hypothetical protein
MTKERLHDESDGQTHHMKKAKDEMRLEYRRSDFTKLECGKFYAEVAKGTVGALLDPPIAKAFPTSKAVNEALRSLLEIAERTSRRTTRSTGRTKGGGASR